MAQDTINLFIKNTQYGPPNECYFHPKVITLDANASHFCYENDGILLKNTDPYPFETYYWPSDQFGYQDMPIPDLPGLYVITAMYRETLWHQIGSPSIKYVGMAMNLKKRLSNHDKLDFVRSEYDISKVSFIAFADGNEAILRANERFLIKTLDPCLNVAHKIKKYG